MSVKHSQVASRSQKSTTSSLLMDASMDTKKPSSFSIYQDWIKDFVCPKWNHSCIIWITQELFHLYQNLKRLLKDVIHRLLYQFAVSSALVHPGACAFPFSHNCACKFFEQFLGVCVSNVWMVLCSRELWILVACFRQEWLGCLFQLKMDLLCSLRFMVWDLLGVLVNILVD